MTYTKLSAIKAARFEASAPPATLLNHVDDCAVQALVCFVFGTFTHGSHLPSGILDRLTRSYLTAVPTSRELCNATAAAKHVTDTPK